MGLKDVSWEGRVVERCLVNVEFDRAVASSSSGVWIDLAKFHDLIFPHIGWSWLPGKNLGIKSHQTIRQFQAFPGTQELVGFLMRSSFDLSSLERLSLWDVVKETLQQWPKVFIACCQGQVRGLIGQIIPYNCQSLSATCFKWKSWWWNLGWNIVIKICNIHICVMCAASWLWSQVPKSFMFSLKLEPPTRFTFLKFACFKEMLS